VASVKHGEDLSAWTVREGWALDFTRYSNGVYATEQKEAESEKRGLWQGEFEPPWEFRKR
jgi:endonuclease YncB( thermonuclease family)